MLDALGFEQPADDVSPVDTPVQSCAISQAAVTVMEVANTFRLVGQIQKRQVMMLVDSGSSHCFVSEAVAAALAGTQHA
jgi:predicted aspartyl protease